MSNTLDNPPNNLAALVALKAKHDSITPSLEGMLSPAEALTSAPEEHPTGLPRLAVRPASLLLLSCDLIGLSAPMLWEHSHVRSLVGLAILTIWLLQMGGLYRTRLKPSFLDELPQLTGRFLSSVGLIATASAIDHPIPNEVRNIVQTACSAGILLLAGRIAAIGIVSRLRRRGTWAHRVVILGGEELSAEIKDVLERYREYGLHVEGTLNGLTGVALMPTALRAAVSQTGADVVLIEDVLLSDRSLSNIVLDSALTSCDIYVVSDSSLGVVATSDHIGAIPAHLLAPANRRLLARLVKRGMDIAVSLIGLLLSLPVLLFCALALRIESGPNVLFRQMRVGLDGRSFELLKFRTMRPVPESESNRTWTVTDPRRIGPVGRIMRMTSVDELPQLWNILRGDMSLVGPRPERPLFVDKFSLEHPRYGARHRVQVGLTGLAQVNGLRGDTSIHDRVRHDNFYIENWTLWLDVKVMLRTFREVLFARGR